VPPAKATEGKEGISDPDFGLNLSREPQNRKSMPGGKRHGSKGGKQREKRKKAKRTAAPTSSKKGSEKRGVTHWHLAAHKKKRREVYKGENINAKAGAEELLARDKGKVVDFSYMLGTIEGSSSW